MRATSHAVSFSAIRVSSWCITQTEAPPYVIFSIFLLLHLSVRYKCPPQHYGLKQHLP